MESKGLLIPSLGELTTAGGMIIGGTAYFPHRIGGKSTYDCGIW